MKRQLLILFLLIAALLSACGPADRDASPEPSETETLESLSVEVPRGALSTEELARVVRELPEALRAALAGQGVEAETVSVSVSSSPAAAAQAVREGGVDLAFLSSEDLAALEDPPQLLLSAGEGETAMSAVIRPEDESLSGDTFAQALAAAVNSLLEDQPVFGPDEYAPVAE